MKELRGQTFVTSDGRQTPDSMKTIYLPLKGGGDIIIVISILGCLLSLTLFGIILLSIKIHRNPKRIDSPQCIVLEDLETRTYRPSAASIDTFSTGSADTYMRLLNHFFHIFSFIAAIITTAITIFILAVIAYIMYIETLTSPWQCGTCRQ